MASLETMLDDLLKREGGYVDHPADRGGPTNHGITLATLRSWRGDSNLAAKDVQKLTEAEAREIYTAKYYHAPKVNHLPESLRSAMFDACVNHGSRKAWMLLQRAANEQGCGLLVDGQPGPKTFAAIEGCGEKKLLQDFIRERHLFYDAIVLRDPTQRVFLKGWLNRLTEFA